MVKVTEPGTGILELWQIEPREDILLALLRELFGEHWREITFGPLVQGAAWEITATSAPERMVYHDGYLTVDFGPMHFHICIGEHRGDDYAPTPPELALHRRTSRAEFFRRINSDDTPDTWGIRLFNGAMEQQITILLPNPFITHELGFEKEPRWERLALWDALRSRYLGLGPDERDRSGVRMLYP